MEYSGESSNGGSVHHEKVIWEFVEDGVTYTAEQLRAKKADERMARIEALLEKILDRLDPPL